MNKCSNLSGEKPQDFNKTIRKALLNGEMISGVLGKRNGDLMAKFTGIVLDDVSYYGIWEKDMLEGKWHLLYFGVKEDVEPEWKEYINFWKQHGERISPMAA